MDANALISLYKTEYDRQPERFAIVSSTASGERLRLRPLQASNENIDERDVRRLTDWRNRYRQYFLTDFTATPERTRRWLTDIAGPDPSRILFMVEAPGEEPFGHIGLCQIGGGYAELDNVVRGTAAPKGAMTAAALALCEWARTSLHVSRLGVRVMADNPAVAFYERLGFRPVKDVSLRFSRSDEGGEWVLLQREGDPGNRYLRHMERAA